MRRASQLRIALDGGDAEVWTWTHRVTGRCWCPRRAVVTLTVNDRQVAAKRRGTRFGARVLLDEGANRIVARCREPAGQEYTSETITLTQRLRNRPTARIRVSVGSQGITLDASTSSCDESSGAAITQYSWRARRGNPARLRRQRHRGALREDKLRLATPDRDGEYYVSVRVVDSEGRMDAATARLVVENAEARAPNEATEHPSWVNSAIIYGVMPHNFGPHGFHSVIQRLDYLKDLGIDAVWLSPCNATPDSGHGYAVTDYFRLRRDYGTKSTFRMLVKEAHARGIRVLMDVVPNHTAIQHRYMGHAQQHGRTSPYYHFYDRDGDSGAHTHYFHWEHLPNLNYGNPAVRRWMLEAFCYWVREFDVDGFRVDAAWGVKLRRPGFWPEWRRELKRVKPDILLLAEASARDPYWFSHGFDAAYDWGDGLGRWSMAQVFSVPDRLAHRLRNALTNEGRGFHRDALIFRFLDNNDTGPRFITRYGLGLARVAAAMLLTLPGLPCIYTGQEVGAEFHPYRTAGPICWEDKHGLRDYYKQLISLRRRIPSLHSGRWEMLDVHTDQQVSAYARYGAPEDPPVLVVLNFSATEASASIRLTADSWSFAGSGRLTDALADEQVDVEVTGQSGIRVSMRGSSARVLVVPSEVVIPP